MFSKRNLFHLIPSCDSLPNVFLTPHTAGVSTQEHWPRMIDLFSQNINRYLSHQPTIKHCRPKRRLLRKSFRRNLYLVPSGSV